MSRAADAKDVNDYPCNFIAPQKRKTTFDKDTGKKAVSYKENYDTENMIADQWPQNGALAELLAEAGLCALAQC